MKNAMMVTMTSSMAVFAFVEPLVVAMATAVEISSRTRMVTRLVTMGTMTTQTTVWRRARKPAVVTVSPVETALSVKRGMKDATTGIRSMVMSVPMTVAWLAVATACFGFS
jgi:hypothetical protein